MARSRIHRWSSGFSWEGRVERWGHVLIDVSHASDRFVSNITCYEMWQSYANTLTGTKANTCRCYLHSTNHTSSIHCKNSVVVLTLDLLLEMCNVGVLYWINLPSAVQYIYLHNKYSWYQSSIHCSMPRRKLVMSVVDGAFILYSQITHLSGVINQLSEQLYCLCSV